MDQDELSARIKEARNNGSTTLNLSRNGLTALPAEIGSLIKLTRLDLVNNQLTTLPPEIGNLTRLTRLDLASNQLTTLPPEIGNLTRLARLDLGYNQITGLPIEIGNLTSLDSLNLNGNQLSTLPTEIGNLTGLDSLSLGYNRITELPPEIGNLIRLTWLDLSENQLLVLPPQIDNLTGLTGLDLLQNQLTTWLPGREDMGDTIRVVIEEWLEEEGMYGLPWWNVETELDTGRLTEQVIRAATKGIYSFLQEKFGYTSTFDDEMDEWLTSIGEDVEDLASSWKICVEEEFYLERDPYRIQQDVVDYWETAVTTIVEAALPNIAQEVGLSVGGAMTQIIAMIDALGTAAKHITTKAVVENLGQLMAGAALNPVGEIVSAYLDYVDQGPGGDVGDDDFEKTVETARTQIQLSIKETVDASTNYTVASFPVKLNEGEHSSVATDLMSAIVGRSRQGYGH